MAEQLFLATKVLNQYPKIDLIPVATFFTYWSWSWAAHMCTDVQNVHSAHLNSLSKGSCSVYFCLLVKSSAVWNNHIKQIRSETSGVQMMCQGDFELADCRSLCRKKRKHVIK